MKWNDTATCEICSMSGFTTHPVTGQTIMETYKEQMLCPSCRIDQRLEDGDYSE